MRLGSSRVKGAARTPAETRSAVNTTHSRTYRWAPSATALLSMEAEMLDRLLGGSDQDLVYAHPLGLGHGVDYGVRNVLRLKPLQL